MTKEEGRTRITILGGFLGAGKTTWLRHQLHVGRFRNSLVIVNEAGASSVDHVLLGDAHQIALIAGGCACCDARSELIELLRSVCDIRSGLGPAAAGRLEEIVIETSGLAEPAAIMSAITTDAVLRHHLVVAETVVLIDAIYGLDQLASEPRSRRQIEAADKLVLSKVDRVSAQHLAGLRSVLMALNPLAEVTATRFGSPLTLPAAPRSDARDIVAAFATEELGPVTSASLALDETVDWAAFTLWLSALLHARGADVLRVKGVMRTPAGRLLLQAVRDSVQSPQHLPEQNPEPADDDRIVIIGRALSEEALAQSLRVFADVD